MAAILFPGSSTPGRLPGEGEGRLINAYVEKAGDTIYWRRVPGLTTYAATGKSRPRGMIDVNGTVYGAFSGGVATVSAGGGASSLGGSLPSTDGVTWARNNKTPTPDLVAVREGGGAFVVNSSLVSGYPDADLPGNVNSVAFLGGFLLFTVPDGRIFASDLNVTDINALSFATAESASDGLLRGIVSGGVFYAMGSASIEPWLNVGATPFPLQRATSVISVGLLTTMAVAGVEEGWDREPIFVAADYSVRILTGYTTQKISTPDVENFVARSTVSTIEASTYVFRGHAIFVLSSDQGTWEYDSTTQEWHERMSLGLTRWRGSRSIKSNGQWLVGDTVTGGLLAIADGTFTEAGDALTFTVESGPVKAFPQRTVIPSAFFDFTPTAACDASISWSRDGGVMWSTPLTRALDPDSHPRNPVRVNRLGLASHHGIRFRLSVSDPVDFSFMGGAIPDPEERAP